MTHEAAPFHRPMVVPPGPSRVQDLPVETAERAAGPVLIDCDTCRVRGLGCGDCVVSVLLGGPPTGVSLNEEERRALEVLAAAGLIPPLRLVQGLESGFVEPP